MPSGVSAFCTVSWPQYFEHGGELRKPPGAGLGLSKCTSVCDSSRPTTACTCVRFAGTCSDAELPRTVWPSVRYIANDVPNAVLACASVPVASTYLLLSGPVALTLNPWLLSQVATAPASALVGEN